MTGHTCRTTGCTRPALSDRATCTSCRPRTYQSKARPPDPDVVDSVLHNRRAVTGLCRTDCQSISRKLTALGVPASEIARIVGRSPRTIARWRAAERASLARLVQSIAETITDAAAPSQYALAADPAITTH